MKIKQANRAHHQKSCPENKKSHQLTSYYHQQGSLPCVDFFFFLKKSLCWFIHSLLSHFPLWSKNWKCQHRDTELVDPTDHYKTTKHTNKSQQLNEGGGTLPVCIWIKCTDISVTVPLRWWIPRGKMLHALSGFSLQYVQNKIIKSLPQSFWTLSVIFPFLLVSAFNLAVPVLGSGNPDCPWLRQQMKASHIPEVLRSQAPCSSELLWTILSSCRGHCIQLLDEDLRF